MHRELTREEEKWHVVDSILQTTGAHLRSVGEVHRCNQCFQCNKTRRKLPNHVALMSKHVAQ